MVGTHQPPPSPILTLAHTTTPDFHTLNHPLPTHTHTHTQAHQLLDDSLHQGGEGDIVVLPVVVDVLDELGNHLGVCLRLKLVALGVLTGGNIIA